MHGFQRNLKLQYINRFAISLKLTQCCKSTILQLRKRISTSNLVFVEPLSFFNIYIYIDIYRYIDIYTHTHIYIHTHIYERQFFDLNVSVVILFSISLTLQNPERDRKREKEGLLWWSSG